MLKYIIGIDTINVMPMPGTTVEELQKESHMVAALLGVNVRFNHNGTIYVVDSSGNMIKQTSQAMLVKDIRNG